MDLARLKSLIDLASSSPLGELDITENGYRVRIRRAGADRQPVPAAAPTDAPSAAPAGPPLARKPLSTAPRAHLVTSPMYGVFHRSPSPDSPPFVAIGHAVKRGDKLCLLEAMKVFNVIESDADGTITEILAESGQEVELGQGLFSIAR